MQATALIISYPRKLGRNRIIKKSNQLWEADIKDGFVEGEDRFFFVMSIIDFYDRGIIAYHMGLSCTGDDVKKTLKRALLKRQQYDKLEKPVIRTDNGPQFISHTFEEFCEDSKIEHERIPPRTPNMNAHIESFHRIFEDDFLSRWQFQTYAEACYREAKILYEKWDQLCKEAQASQEEIEVKSDRSLGMDEQKPYDEDLLEGCDNIFFHW